MGMCIHTQVHESDTHTCTQKHASKIPNYRNLDYSATFFPWVFLTDPIFSAACGNKNQIWITQTNSIRYDARINDSTDNSESSLTQVKSMPAEFSPCLQLFSDRSLPDAHDLMNWKKGPLGIFWQVGLLLSPTFEALSLRGPFQVTSAHCLCMSITNSSALVPSTCAFWRQKLCAIYHIGDLAAVLGWSSAYWGHGGSLNIWKWPG